MTTHPTRSSSRSSSSSVFDRLYSKSTESSLRKSAGKEEENSGNVSASKNISSSNKNGPNGRCLKVVAKRKTNNVRSKTGTGSSEVYNRLYSKGTASYNSKRKTVVTGSQSESSSSSNNNVIITMIPLKTTTNSK